MIPPSSIFPALTAGKFYDFLIDFLSRPQLDWVISSLQKELLILELVTFANQPLPLGPGVPQRVFWCPAMTRTAEEETATGKWVPIMGHQLSAC